LTSLVTIGGIAVAFAATTIDELAGPQAVHTAGPINAVLRVGAYVALGVAVLTPIVGHLGPGDLKHR
ncbi:MAG TPA: hypothetical protein VGH85_02325, partial [Mycobacteriales bacterium]|jgi:hypothetical protein